MQLGSHHSPETRAKMSAARLGRTHSPETRAKVAAAKIGEKNPMWGLTHTDEARAKISAKQRGENNHKWSGGRFSRADGYVHVHSPEHPMADSKGYVYEHRLVVAERIGRNLASSEIVHHVNTIRDDNRPENLWLFPDTEAHAYWHAILEHGSEFARPMAAVQLY